MDWTEWFRAYQNLKEEMLFSISLVNFWCITSIQYNIVIYHWLAKQLISPNRALHNVIATNWTLNSRKIQKSWLGLAHVFELCTKFSAESVL